MENEVVHLMIKHGHFILVGIIALIGATMLVLKKLGFLVFDKERIVEDKNEFCTYCSLVDIKTNKDKVYEKLPILDDLKRQVKCDDHQSLCNTVKEMRKTQIEMSVKQVANVQALSNGKEEFRKLHERIADLKIGVAVLLDRSGSMIKEFEDVKRS